MSPNPQHLIVLMLENRSFDHMLGYLMSPIYRIDGLSGNEFNLDSRGNKWLVTNGAAFYGKLPPEPSDGPAHDFTDVAQQIATEAMPDGSTHPMAGFVRNYEAYLAKNGYNNSTVPNVMNCFKPAAIPILTTLAQQYAVCDRWFSSLPGPTLPNRVFTHAGTSGGATQNPPIGQLTTLFEVFAKQGITSALFCGDTTSMIANKYLLANSAVFIKSYDDFGTLCKADKLPSYCFIEPQYHPHGNYLPNDQHPDNDIRDGELLIKDVYQTIRSNDAVWKKSMLLIVYDEHGGLYDHVTPPSTIAPDASPTVAGDPPFNFLRLGVRVPAVLISPYIDAGTIWPNDKAAALDHTSIIATALKLFAPTLINSAPLGARARTALAFDTVAALNVPRDDNPLETAALTPARALSQLQKQLLTHVASAEESLPWNLQSGISVANIQTDREAGRYVSHVMRNLKHWRGGGS